MATQEDLQIVELKLAKLKALYEKVNPEKEKIARDYLDSVLDYRELAEEIVSLARSYQIDVTLPDGYIANSDDDDYFYCDVGWLPSSMEC